MRDITITNKKSDLRRLAQKLRAFLLLNYIFSKIEL
jgi:hypothetical protein